MHTGTNSWFRHCTCTCVCIHVHVYYGIVYELCPIQVQGVGKGHRRAIRLTTKARKAHGHVCWWSIKSSTLIPSRDRIYRQASRQGGPAGQWNHQHWYHLEIVQAGSAGRGARPVREGRGCCKWQVHVRCSMLKSICTHTYMFWDSHSPDTGVPGTCMWRLSLSLFTCCKSEITLIKHYMHSRYMYVHR